MLWPNTLAGARVDLLTLTEGNTCMGQTTTDSENTSPFKKKSLAET